jgi:hypothetical protein
LTVLPDRIDLPTPRVKFAALLVICLALAAAGLWMVSEREPAGWVAAVFFGFCALMAAVAVATGAGLSLDPEGFTMRSALRRKRYLWAQVSTFSTARAGRRDYIVFDDHSRRAGWLSRTAGALMGGNSSIPAAIISGSLEDACKLLNAFRERAAGT